MEKRIDDKIKRWMSCSICNEIKRMEDNALSPGVSSNEGITAQHLRDLHELVEDYSRFMNTHTWVEKKD